MMASEALCRSALRGRERRRPDIRNVTFVNARTTVLRCLVLNVPVDVTAHTLESLGAQVLLEEADRLIGSRHLFKKTLLLVKAWCKHEAPRYGDGVAALDSRNGRLSTAALAVLCLFLFLDVERSALDATHPIRMLAAFLRTYARRDDWTAPVTLVAPVGGRAGGYVSDESRRRRGRG